MFSWFTKVWQLLWQHQRWEHVLAGFSWGKSFYTGIAATCRFFFSFILFTKCTFYSLFMFLSFDNLSPSRLLLSAWLYIWEGSGFLQNKGGFSWQVAGTLVYHVSWLPLQSINWVCCSPEAGLYPCGASNLVQQPVSYHKDVDWKFPVNSCQNNQGIQSTSNRCCYHGSLSSPFVWPWTKETSRKDSRERQCHAHI